MKARFHIFFIIITLALAALIVNPVTPAAQAAGLELKGKSCVLLDAQSGNVLYQQNPDVKCYPASVTKVMTLVLILEALNSGQIALDDIVITSGEAAGMGGSQVYLYEGEKRSVEEMIIAIAVGSGNDASVAMAEFVGGSEAGFVEMMNKRAQELGMTNTHFANPHGLHDENHYTTAMDMAKLAYHALYVPNFIKYTSIYEYDFRPEPKPLKLWNTNRLLKWYDGCDGIKTGYTPEAGRNLVATAKRNGLRLISVVMGVSEAKGHFTESMKLLNYGFNNYSFDILFPAGQIMAQTGVSKGAKDNVGLMPEKDVGELIKKGDKAKITSRVECKPYLNAPLHKGDQAGEIILMKDDAEIGRFNLVVAEEVDKCSFWRMFAKLLREVGFNFLGEEA